MLDKRHYIRRCHELAILGARQASPNPMVGSVIVVDQEIIGEGWHRAYGEAHAEINALNSVQTMNLARLVDATIFVSLEPCSIYGRTPPCTEAILEADIKKVVVSSRDKTAGVDGVSEYVLKEKNLELSYGIGHQLGDLIAAPRNIFVAKKRPYIILKWAQSSDGYIALNNEQTPISNAYTLRYVHQLRSEVDAIVIGNRTAIIDNPSLTTRHYPGHNPLRVVLGNLDSRTSANLKLLNDKLPTVVIGSEKMIYKNESVRHIQVPKNQPLHAALCSEMYACGIQKILVEGGSTTLQHFLDTGLWDECRIITNARALKSGIKAPTFPEIQPFQVFNLLDDNVQIFHNL